MNKKPDQIVAEKIISQLLEKQLLSKERKEEWMQKLSSESASDSDWSLLADFYIREKEQTDDQR